MQPNHFSVPTRPRSIVACARELDRELSGGERDTGWDRSRAKMDLAEAELKRVAAEVRAVPALIDAVNRQFRRFVRQEREQELRRKQR